MSISANATFIQRSSTFPSTLMFVFLKEKWQNPPVPVENGEDKRGGRLPGFAGYSRVIIARLQDIVGAALRPGGHSQQ